MSSRSRNLSSFQSKNVSAPNTLDLFKFPTQKKPQSPRVESLKHKHPELIPIASEALAAFGVKNPNDNLRIDYSPLRRVSLQKQAQLLRERILRLAKEDITEDSRFCYKWKVSDQLIPTLHRSHGGSTRFLIREPLSDDADNFQQRFFAGWNQDSDFWKAIQYPALDPKDQSDEAIYLREIEGVYDRIDRMHDIMLTENFRFLGNQMERSIAHANHIERLSEYEAIPNDMIRSVSRSITEQILYKGYDQGNWKIEDQVLKLRLGQYRPSGIAPKQLSIALSLLSKVCDDGESRTFFYPNPSYFYSCVASNIKEPKKPHAASNPVEWAKQTLQIAHGFGACLLGRDYMIDSAEKPYLKVASVVGNYQEPQRKREKIITISPEMKVVLEDAAKFLKGRSRPELIWLISQQSDEVAREIVNAVSTQQFSQQLPLMLERGLRIERVGELFAGLKKQNISTDAALEISTKISEAIFNRTETAPWWFKEDFSFCSAALPSQDLIELAQISGYGFRAALDLYQNFKTRFEDLDTLDRQQKFYLLSEVANKIYWIDPVNANNALEFMLLSLVESSPLDVEQRINDLMLNFSFNKESSVSEKILSKHASCLLDNNLAEILAGVSGDKSIRSDAELVSSAILSLAKPVHERNIHNLPRLTGVSNNVPLLATTPERTLRLSNYDTAVRTVAVKQASLAPLSTWNSFLSLLKDEVAKPSERVNSLSIYFLHFAMRLPDPFTPPPGLLNFISRFQYYNVEGWDFEMISHPRDRQKVRERNADRYRDRRIIISALIDLYTSDILSWPEVQKIFDWLETTPSQEHVRKIQEEVSWDSYLPRLRRIPELQEYDDRLCKQIRSHAAIIFESKEPPSKAWVANAEINQRRESWLRDLNVKRDKLEASFLRDEYRHYDSVEAWFNDTGSLDPIERSRYIAESQISDWVREERAARFRELEDTFEIGLLLATPLVSTLLSQENRREILRKHFMNLPQIDSALLPEERARDDAQDGLAKRFDRSITFSKDLLRDTQASFLSAFINPAQLTSKLGLLKSGTSLRTAIEALGRVNSQIKHLIFNRQTDVIFSPQFRESINQEIIAYDLVTAPLQPESLISSIERAFCNKTDQLRLVQFEAANMLDAILPNKLEGQALGNATRLLAGSIAYSRMLEGLRSLQKSFVKTTAQALSDSTLEQRLPEILADYSMALSSGLSQYSSVVAENSEEFKEKLLTARIDSFGLLPVGAKVHVFVEHNSELLDQFKASLKLDSTSFRLLHANRSMLLPPTPSSYELSQFIAFMKNEGIISSEYPEIQITFSGKLPVEDCPYLGATLLVASPKIFLFNEDSFQTADPGHDSMVQLRMMSYDAGTDVLDLPFNDPKGGRTDVLGRQVSWDFHVGQRICTVLNHGRFGGPFAELCPWLKSEIDRVFENAGIKSVLSASWIWDRQGAGDLPNAGAIHFREAIEPCINARLESDRLFDEKGELAGIFKELNEVIEELIIRVKSIQDQMLESPEYARERAVLFFEE